ncbi:DUF6262 family protein [Streptomyces sp. CG1]|uniref:DUF6262 family protein n=1 Tax=Streptomyces sp. CG1 TaxID=1287523 RepID=UPI0034E1A3F5
MATRTPADVLAESRRQPSLLKRQRVLDTIRLILDDDEPISFAAVARAAKVSTWLVYAEGIRDHVHAAIHRQEQAPSTGAAQGRRARPASLHADLAMAREEIKELRTERDQLRSALRQHLGHQLDQISNRSLTERVNELTEANRKLERERAQLRPIAGQVPPTCPKSHDAPRVRHQAALLSCLAAWLPGCLAASRGYGPRGSQALDRFRPVSPRSASEPIDPSRAGMVAACIATPRTMVPHHMCP